MQKVPKKITFRKLWRKTRHARGFLTKAEAFKLFRMAARKNPPGDIVEIGAHEGKKTAFLAAGAARSGKDVIAIDPFVGRTWLLDILDEDKPLQSMEANFIREAPGEKEAMTRFWATLEDAGLDDYVSLALIESQQVEADSDISLLVIDGDHRGAAVAADLNTFLPKVVENGCVIFPDFANPRYQSRQELVKTLSRHPRVASCFVVGSLWGAILGPPDAEDDAD